MKYQVEMLEPSIEAALISLAKIADLTICRVTVVEIEDHSPALPVVAALLARYVDGVTMTAAFQPAAPFVEEEEDRLPDIAYQPATELFTQPCPNCGLPFVPRRKDQKYCTREERKKAVNSYNQALAKAGLAAVSIETEPKP